MWKRKGGKDERTRIGPHAQITKFSKTICLWLNKTGVEAKRWRLAPRETAQRTRLTTYQSMRRNWCAPGARSHLSACLFFRKTRGHLFPLDRANSAPEINGQLGFFFKYIYLKCIFSLWAKFLRARASIGAWRAPASFPVTAASIRHYISLSIHTTWFTLLIQYNLLGRVVFQVNFVQKFDN